MSSTRDRILQTLVRKPRSTINALAEAVGINPISVRHHLTNLQVEGLVGMEEEHHGVGRPRLVYSLTESGTERFPTHYLRLTTRLLDQLKSTMPEKMVNQLFSQMASDLSRDYAGEMHGLTIEQRLNLLKNLLAEEGFNFEWEKNGNQYQIHEITCPYLHIGKNHPEVCTVDQTLISEFLSLPTEKVKCILVGDDHCTYVVKINGNDR